jgi:hypothetical protein
MLTVLCEGAWNLERHRIVVFGPSPGIAVVRQVQMKSSEDVGPDRELRGSPIRRGTMGVRRARTARRRFRCVGTFQRESLLNAWDHISLLLMCQYICRLTVAVHYIVIV